MERLNSSPAGDALSLKFHRDFFTIPIAIEKVILLRSPVEPNKHWHVVNRYDSPPCIFAKAPGHKTFWEQSGNSILSHNLGIKVAEKNLAFKMHQKYHHWSSHPTPNCQLTKLPVGDGSNFKTWLVPSHVFERFQLTLATHATRVFQVRDLARCFLVRAAGTSMVASKQEGMNPKS